ncbi:MAG: hypothetical protein Q8N51_17155 [Gammaproteobacteria bacterium]|nr:hypothetical protein [Gammaproteobacteria bacterium]
MPAPSPLAPFIEPLERLALPYCITGSVAASVYGEPRLTADIDIVLVLRLPDIPVLQSAFPEAEYYVPPAETIREAVARSAGGMFNLIHHRSQFKADMYLASRDPLHAWALEYRRRIDLGGSGAWIAPPEYVILRKLEFLREGGSDKHLRDILFILAATAVDRSFIESEVGRRDLRGLWLKSADGQ